MSAPTTAPANWMPLVTHAGGVGLLAEALGVPPRTLRHWMMGDRTPTLFAQRAVGAWCTRRKLESPYQEAR